MKITLQQQLEAYKQGVILDSDGGQSECYNFFDWFCSDKSLKGKAKRLFGSLRTFLKHHPEIDTSKVYVWFKNNCPFNGSLYDDFRIADIETQDVLWTVIPKEGRNYKAEIWGKINDFKEAYKVADTYKDLFKQ